MCVASYIKFYLLVFLFPIIASFGGIFIILGILIIGIFEAFIKCPKCKKPIGRTVDGWYSPLRWYTCDKCGQNLLKCDVEPDEITNKRLK